MQTRAASGHFKWSRTWPYARIWSNAVHSSRILPSTMRQTVMPRISIRAPVGGSQPYPECVCRPRKVQTTVTRSPLATMSSTEILRSGKAAFS